MSIADLAYMQQILNDTFEDIWAAPADCAFKAESGIPAWALEAWTWPRDIIDALDGPERDHDESSDESNDESGEESDKESGDEPLQTDEYGCRFSVSPVRFSYTVTLD
jgi:hypothetical protein